MKKKKILKKLLKKVSKIEKHLYSEIKKKNDLTNWGPR